MQFDALIDDVVRHIFTFLSLPTRAKLGEVSKRWFGTSRHPSLWAVVEYDFDPVKSSTVRAARQAGKRISYAIDSFGSFLVKYASSLVDLHLSYTPNPDRKDRLDEFFQIKSLRRMKIVEKSDYKVVNYYPLKTPACSNLELLNIEFTLPLDTLATLLQGLPNLKELYILSCTIENVSDRLKHALSITTKLDRIYLQLPKSPHAILRELKEACSSLRYIVYIPLYPRGYDDSDEEEDADDELLIEVGDAIAVTPETFSDAALKKYYRLLGPLLVDFTNIGHSRERTFLALLASDYLENKQLIHYLVQEMHFDLNAALPKRAYRMSFQTHYTIQQLREHYDYVLEAASMRGTDTDLRAVSELIALGARAECPSKSQSFLTSAKRADVRLYLIQHGADPNKMVEINFDSPTKKYPFQKPPSTPTTVPAFAMHFIDPSLQDSGEFVASLHGKVDFNLIVLGKSLLECAIQTKKWASVAALMALGVKADEDSLLALLQGEKQRFQELLAGHTVDVKSLPVKVVVEAIHNNLAPALVDYLRANIDKNENGYNLLHYLAVTSLKQHPNPTYKTKKGKGRWIVQNNTEKVPEKLPEKATEKPTDPWQGLSIVERLERMSKDQLAVLQNYWRSGPPTAEELHPIHPNEGVEEDEDDEMEESSEDDIEMELVENEEHDGDTEHRIQQVSDIITERMVTLAKQAVAKRAEERKKVEDDFDWLELFSLCNYPSIINSTTKDGETALLLVCKSQVSPEVKQKRVTTLIAHGADVNIADNQGWTPLHAACYLQMWDVALTLIKAGANVNAQDQNGVTPIMAAVYGWHQMPDQQPRDLDADLLMAHLQNLVRATNSIDLLLREKDTNRTFLHLIATVNGTKWAIRDLFKHITVNDWDADGFTPLHYATIFGATEMIKSLVEFGCDLNAKTTAMQMTAAMMYFLIIDKSDYSGYKKCLENCITSLLGNYQYKPIKIGTKDKLAMVVETPWNFQGYMNDAEKHSGYTNIANVVDTLMYFLANSDLTLIDGNGNNYLHYIVNFCAGKPDSVPPYCSKYVALESLWSKKNYHNTSPFHKWMSQTIKRAEDEIVTIMVDLIVKHNIDIHERDDDGKSILYHMCYSNVFRFHPELFERLKGQFNFTTHFSEPNKNAFDSIIIGGNLTNELLKVIIETNPEVLNQPIRRGQTLLLFDMESSFEFGEIQGVSKDEMQMILSQKNININHQDDNGDTALHIACRYFTLGVLDSVNGHMASFKVSSGFFEVPFLLLNVGADPTIKNDRGETPLTYVPRLMDYYERLYKEWVEEVIQETVW